MKPPAQQRFNQNPSDQHQPCSSDTSPARPARTALVLGGGGSAGNAWLIGVIAGLDDAGLTVSTADLIVGTSAGSTAAAQITGANAAALLADILAGRPGGHGGPGGPGRAVDHGAPARPNTPAKPASNQLERTNRIINAAGDAADMRRQIGAAALDLGATSDPAVQERWRTTVAARLPDPHWPLRRLLITAVDAQTGEPVVFDRDSGVNLVDAVAASCASSFAYRIDDRLFIDGGYRSNADNADLAAGYPRVLVLSPFGGRSRTPAGWGLHLVTQIDHLRAHGSVVETIFPNAESRAAFGDNMMDLSARARSARAGYDQGRAVAARLADFWR